MKPLITLIREAAKSTGLPKVLWHATPYDKFLEIAQQGRINPGSDQVVYFTDTPGGSVRFIAFRGENRIVALPVKVAKLDKSKIQESFDHSIEFWKTRAWFYPDPVPMDKIDWDNIRLFEL